MSNYNFLNCSHEKLIIVTIVVWKLYFRSTKCRQFNVCYGSSNSDSSCITWSHLFMLHRGVTPKGKAKSRMYSTKKNVVALATNTALNVPTGRISHNIETHCSCCRKCMQPVLKVHAVTFLYGAPQNVCLAHRRFPPISLSLFYSIGFFPIQPLSTVSIFSPTPTIYSCQLIFSFQGSLSLCFLTLFMWAEGILRKNLSLWISFPFHWTVNNL